MNSASFTEIYDQPYNDVGRYLLHRSADAYTATFDGRGLEQTRRKRRAAKPQHVLSEVAL